MAMEICPSCGGTGGSYATDWVEVPPDGGYREVQVWKSCSPCNGGGTIWVQDSVPSTPFGLGSGAGARGRPVKSSQPSTLEQKDQKFASLLVAVVAVAAFYFVFGGDWRFAFDRVVSGRWDADFWVRVIAVAAIAIVSSRLLSRYRGFVRYLRYAAAASLIIALCWFFYSAFQ